jgi:RNA polymerase sigma factor (sigma-70 family)
VTTTTTETTTVTEATEAAAASPSLSPAVGRPDPGPAGALVAKLFDEHGRMVVGLCRLLLRDAVEAEDAAQQVFLSAYRSVLGGAVPRDAPAWLAVIARNECRARIRARMREPLALTEVQSDLPDPLAAAIARADLEAVWVALSELPRRQRRAFLLRELGGLSYGELGRALGVTRPAVESLLFRARQYVRNALAGANAALVPLALRDQLARLIPGFSTAPAASIPIAAKVAAVTAGAGLGAVGVVALPDHHSARHARQDKAEIVPALAVSTPSAPASKAAQAEDLVAGRERGREHEHKGANRAGEEHARGGDDGRDEHQAVEGDGEQHRDGGSVVGTGPESSGGGDGGSTQTTQTSGSSDGSGSGDSSSGGSDGSGSSSGSGGSSGSDGGGN